MEMEKSAMLSKALRLTKEEDAMASQVLEIIGGLTLEALQTLEEPDERDVWSIEEGDDSVFYSDEDQAHQDIKAITSCDFGVNGCRRLVNSEAADEPIPQREDYPGAEVITDLQVSEMEKEVTPLVLLTEQEEKYKELQTPKTEPMTQSDPADPGTETKLIHEKSVSTWGKSLQLNCTLADLQIHPGQNTSSGEVNLPVEAQTPNLEPFVVSNEERYTRLSEEPVVPNHTKSFNHLTSSKYSTVSYRKIRRGNTRQKIEDFESMIMNL